ncbi:hypothetical protein NOR_08217 [Metarhizium rileyi]|uniref:Uncharacterized protein n=1 Tax=Metarhizium rileyi (strain RCEF 4871) TaxID=1649241 RepID=A0A166WQ52_METRR|nr:hypothetical protein NOR_08217 [Metarhizium rileyi RCEF 4871]
MTNAEDGKPAQSLVAAIVQFGGDWSISICSNCCDGHVDQARCVAAPIDENNLPWKMGACENCVQRGLQSTCSVSLEYLRQRRQAATKAFDSVDGGRESETSLPSDIGRNARHNNPARYRFPMGIERTAGSTAAHGRRVVRKGPGPAQKASSRSMLADGAVGLDVELNGSALRRYVDQPDMSPDEMERVLREWYD